MDPESTPESTIVSMQNAEPIPSCSSPKEAESSGLESSQLQEMEVEDCTSTRRKATPVKKQISSPTFTDVPLHRALFKGLSSPALIQRREKGQLSRELSKPVFKSRSGSMTKHGKQCREELHQFLQHRGCKSLTLVLF